MALQRARSPTSLDLTQVRANLIREGSTRAHRLEGPRLAGVAAAADLAQARGKQVGPFADVGSWPDSRHNTLAHSWLAGADPASLGSLDERGG